MNKQSYYCDSEARQMAFGSCLAKICAGQSLTIFLDGDLGAGKTTLTRGFLRGLGYQGAVRSPTYTLVEPYPLQDKTVYHLDLYRLGDPEELEFLGGREIFSGNNLVLVEWPQRGQGWLPEADIVIDLLHQPPGRRLEVTCQVEVCDDLRTACAGFES